MTRCLAVIASNQDNIEIVRRGFDAFQAMDIDAFVADWHPELVWDVHGYEDWPGTKAQYKGTPEILAEFANFMGSVRALEVTNLEITPLEPNRVLAIYDERRINEGDAGPIELHIGIVYELTGGKITRIEVYTGTREPATRRRANNAPPPPEPSIISRSSAPVLPARPSGRPAARAAFWCVGAMPRLSLVGALEEPGRGAPRRPPARRNGRDPARDISKNRTPSRDAVPGTLEPRAFSRPVLRSVISS